MQLLPYACLFVAACTEQVTGPATLTASGSTSTLPVSAYYFPNDFLGVTATGVADPPAAGGHGVIVLDSAAAGTRCDAVGSTLYNIYVAVPGNVTALDDLPPGSFSVIDFAQLTASLAQAAALILPVGMTEPIATSGTLTLTSIAHDRIDGRFDASSSTATVSATFSANRCDHVPGQN
jgi:hypothetical protein